MNYKKNTPKFEVETVFMKLLETKEFLCHESMRNEHIKFCETGSDCLYGLFDDAECICTYNLEEFNHD